MRGHAPGSREGGRTHGGCARSPAHPCTAAGGLALVRRPQDPPARGERRRRGLHPRQHLLLVGPAGPPHPRQPGLRDPHRAGDPALLPLRDVAARQVAAAVAPRERRPARGSRGEPDLGRLRRDPRHGAVALLGRRLLPLLLSSGHGRPAAVPQGHDDAGGSHRIRARRRGRALRLRHDRGPLPHHPDAAVDQWQPAGAARLGRLSARRRAAVLRPHVARGPAPLTAARRQQCRAGRRAHDPAGRRPAVQPSDLDRPRQRDAAQQHGRAVLDPGRVGGLRAPAQQVRRRDLARDRDPQHVRLHRGLRGGARRLRRPAVRRRGRPGYAVRCDDRGRRRRDPAAPGATGAGAAGERDAARAQGVPRD